MYKCESLGHVCTPDDVCVVNDRAGKRFDCWQRVIYLCSEVQDVCKCAQKDKDGKPVCTNKGCTIESCENRSPASPNLKNFIKNRDARTAELYAEIESIKLQKARAVSNHFNHL